MHRHHEPVLASTVPTGTIFNTFYTPSSSASGRSRRQFLLFDGRVVRRELIVPGGNGNHVRR